MSEKMNEFDNINMDYDIGDIDIGDFENLIEQIPLENELDNSQKTYLNLEKFGWPESYFNPDDMMEGEGENYENVQPDVNEVDVTPVNKTVNKTKKGRHRLEEGEKKTRRKESNRKAAEKYRNKKKKEQMTIFEKHEHLKNVVKELLSSVKDNLVTIRNKDSKLLQSIANAEHALTLTQ